ncbi:uncharacterized protein EV420DRAFT_1537339, partial [Desarmillaria tabescens]
MRAQRRCERTHIHGYAITDTPCRHLLHPVQHRPPVRCPAHPPTSNSCIPHYLDRVTCIIALFTPLMPWSSSTGSLSRHPPFPAHITPIITQRSLRHRYHCFPLHEASWMLSMLTSRHARLHRILSTFCMLQASGGRREDVSSSFATMTAR